MNFKFLLCRNLPILEQLKLEEALLRISDDNWCMINVGTTPAIVMGISGKPQELIHLSDWETSKIPLIKRFSGGGTVIVDENTLFVTFIANQSALSIKKEPKAIMSWTKEIFMPLFHNLPFSLKENDYVLGEKKFGGNAQYIQRDRWLHHCSLLWDYCPKKMSLLKIPQRRPQYRIDRDHDTFLTPLSHHFSCLETFLKNLTRHLQYSLNGEIVSLEELAPILEKPHRKATCLYLFQ